MALRRTNLRGLRWASVTTTSEERREVAERLRGYPMKWVKADHKGKDPLQLPADVMYDLMDIAGVCEDFDSLFPALADLLDPTCEVESVDSTVGLLAYNLSCGDTVFVHLNEPMPSYCPYCGARLLLEHEFFPHELFPRFMTKEVHE